MRDPNSRRGRAEILKRQKLTAVEAGDKTPAAPLPPINPEAPKCPPGLPRRVAEIWQNLVFDLLAARVPIKQVDAHAILMAARTLDAVEAAERIAEDGELDAEKRLTALRLKAQFGKDLIQWLQLICATPGTRARIGVGGQPKKAAGPLAQLLAAKQGRK